jgi:acylphosphatase
MTGRARARVLVSGRVQGVGYRYSCRREALGRRLAGWVRNLEDGRVEALFEGPREAVEALIEWCRRGPEGARVTDVVVDWSPPAGETGDFSVAR